MKIFSTLLVAALAVPAIASAQAQDPDDLTGYTRFVVYPHLQQGLDSMQRGDRSGALAEFERARSLAPANATVALRLATAYQTFGDLQRAETMLREQLALTPGDPRVRAALTALRTLIAPPAARPVAPAATNGCVDADGVSCSKVPGPAAPGQLPTNPSPGVLSAAASTTAVSSPASAPKRERVQHAAALPAAASAPLEHADNTPQFAGEFMRALEARDFDHARQHADAWLAHDATDATLIDSVSFKLVTAGAIEQATSVLLNAYPFANRGPAERDALLQRLIGLVEQQRGGLPDGRVSPLRQPLDTPALRSRQAVLWERLGDCQAVRALLGDMSSQYGYSDWLRLGDCSSGSDPNLAERAYVTAHMLEPGGRASRALGYQAHANGHFAAALLAWRSVGLENLSGDDLLAAATTGVAAGAPEQATSWLIAYRGRGETLNHRYWSLLADTTLRADPSAAAESLTHAILLQPEADDYRRLAFVEQDLARRVMWLERAVALDPADSSLQAELGYAYSRNGLPASAVIAFERAAAVAPLDAAAQGALGYAYWSTGRPAAAQRALESSFEADPTARQIAEQLVYVHQRQGHNREARAYAERALDAYAASAASTGDAAGLADQRFDLQRTHEDLGRRVTVLVDGWSGTHVGTGTSASPAGSGYRSYSQAEVDIRLGNQPIRDGRTVSAYARVFADGGERARALPSQNAVLGVGLRWKPFRNQVIYLAAENQNGLDDRSRRDVLLRASASFFNGGRTGDDWHASRGGWFSQNLYLDAAQYLETHYSAFTSDYRTSYHRKLSAAQTVEPYVHLQFNGVQDAAFKRDVRGGAGVRWNIWQGATRYDAAPHKFSIGVEFQQALQTYLPDQNGVFLTFGTRW